MIETPPFRAVGFGFVWEGCNSFQIRATHRAAPYVRTLFDCWLSEQIRQGLLRPEGFGMKDGGCMMGKAARLRFYQAYEKVAKKMWRGKMVDTCRRLLRDLGGFAGGGEAFELPQRYSEGWADEVAGCL